MGLKRSNQTKTFQTSFVITSGKYEGWRAYGPYIKNGRDYYRLIKENQQKDIYLTDGPLEFDLPEKKESKPFLDWIK